MRRDIPGRHTGTRIRGLVEDFSGQRESRGLQRLCSGASGPKSHRPLGKSPHRKDKQEPQRGRERDSSSQCSEAPRKDDSVWGPRAHGKSRSWLLGLWGSRAPSAGAPGTQTSPGNKHPAPSQPVHLTWIAFSSFRKRRISSGPFSMVGMCKCWRRQRCEDQEPPFPSHLQRQPTSPCLGTGSGAQGRPGKRCPSRRLPERGPPPAPATAPSW